MAAQSDEFTRDSPQCEFRILFPGQVPRRTSAPVLVNSDWRDSFGDRLGSFTVLANNSIEVHLEGVGQFSIDSDLESTVTASPSASRDAALEQFWHAIAPFVLEARGWGCLHAGAAACDGAVVAFCGPSGRGKSTLSYSLGRRWGVSYADDALVFLPGQDRILAGRLPQAPSLRRTARENLDATDLGPNLLDRFDVAATLIPLACVYWLDGMTDSPAAPLIATERIPATEAFQLLLSEAHASPIEDAAAKRRVVENYLKLTAGVPTYRLRFQAGFDRYDAVLDEIEKHFRELVNPTS